MSEGNEQVQLPKDARENLAEILSHAASQDRTLVEFRTPEDDSGATYLNAIEVTEYVEELEERCDDVPTKES